jgi:Xaa-Pro aminopeptidase
VNGLAPVASEPPLEPVRRSAVRGSPLALEFEHKLSIVRAALDRRGAKAASLSSRRNFAWVTAGGDNHVVDASEVGVATLVVTGRDAVVVTPRNEASRIRDEELRDLGLDLVGVPWEVAGAVETEVARIGGGQVATDADLEDDLRPSRMVLNDRERAEMLEIGETVSRAMTEVLATVTGGDLETVVAARLGVILATAGIALPVVLAASDGRIPAYRHPIPKPKPIEHSLMLVVCAQRRGLIVAATRFLWLVAPKPELARRFDAVSRVHRALREATRPEVSFANLFGTARDAYAREGYADEWQLHHQGGAIGYQPREEFATPLSRMIVRPGMAFAWNPSITGAKAEDTLVLDARGIASLVTRDPSWPANRDGEVREWVRDG